VVPDRLAYEPHVRINSRFPDFTGYSPGDHTVGQRGPRRLVYAATLLADEPSRGWQGSVRMIPAGLPAPSAAARADRDGPPNVPGPTREHCARCRSSARDLAVRSPTRHERDPRLPGAGLRRRGPAGAPAKRHRPRTHELEIPHGPCATFTMKAGQRYAVYQLVRPEAVHLFDGLIDPDPNRSRGEVPFAFGVVAILAVSGALVCYWCRSRSRLPREARPLGCFPTGAGRWEWAGC
jgi:hypothetical protein